MPARYRYAGRIGLEAAHAATREERAWLAAAAETVLADCGAGVGAGERRNALVAMTTAEEFEHFLQVRAAPARMAICVPVCEPHGDMHSRIRARMAICVPECPRARARACSASSSPTSATPGRGARR